MATGSCVIGDECAAGATMRRLRHAALQFATLRRDVSQMRLILRPLLTTGLALSILASLVAAPHAADAQVGSTTDIILGRVTGPDSLPLENARVEVTSAESGITRNRLTNDKGQYAIVFPDGGGAYTLRVTYLGMAPFQTTLQRQADEDRLVANVQMSRAQAHELAPVVVRGQQRPQGPPRPEAGNTERLLSSGQTTRMPVDAGNLNDLATLAPGVIGIAGTDSTPQAFSVAGQPSDQNSITLDGLSFGRSEIPQEALRATRVITSTYDVGRGQFTGGMIASTTRGGTNMKQGVFNYSFRDPSLEFVDEDASFGKYRQNQLSGGFGLPIVKDKAFAFGAFTVSRRTTDLMSLLSADSVTLQRLGTDPALVDRFLGAMNGYGIPATLPGIPRDALVDHANGLVRGDYRLNHSPPLMVRRHDRWAAP